MGGAKRTRGAKRERVEGRREGDERGGGERGPVLLPVKQVAMLSEPLLNARVEDD